ncbi:UbiA prenyltransferase family [Penicillium herquei]|nr:UbiA prenyltransferase family [Penicillium herquei]
MYNDLGGGDEDFVLENMIIEIAFGLYNAGSLKIAGGSGSTTNNQGAIWIIVMNCVIFTTMHAQDLKDPKVIRAEEERQLPLLWVIL